MWLYIFGIIAIIILIAIVIGLYFLSQYLFRAVLDFATFGRFPWSNFVYDDYYLYRQFFEAELIPDGISDAERTFAGHYQKIPGFYSLNELNKKVIQSFFQRNAEILIGWRKSPNDNEEAKWEFTENMQNLKIFLKSKNLPGFEEAMLTEYEGAFVNNRKVDEIGDVLLKINEYITALEKTEDTYQEY